MRQAAKDGDPQAKGEFERAVKSLGLRPNRVQSSRDVPVVTDRTAVEVFEPPAETAEQVPAVVDAAFTITMGPPTRRKCSAARAVSLP